MRTADASRGPDAGRPLHADDIPPIVAERFWTKVERTNSCWPWTGPLTRSGYGSLRWKRGDRLTILRSHRVGFALAVGPIPAGAVIGHRCDNPPCCNPSHLELIDQTQNNRDAVARRRHSQTQKTHCAQGHPYDDENTYLRPDGARTCRICHRGAVARSTERRRSA